MICYALHYFRLAPHAWPYYLRRVHQLGASMVYTPVPWGWHAWGPSETDLRGSTHPRRNLLGFVALTEAVGLQLRLDLTPVAAAEAQLLHNGLPTWLMTDHSDLLPRDADGRLQAALSPEHPTARQLVERWYQTLGPQLNASHFSVQVDLRQMPLAGQTEHVARVQWPIWLRKQFAEGGIDALNARYGSTYRRVSEVPFDAPLAAPAFAADKAEFIDQLNGYIQDTYLDMLEAQGFQPQAPLDTPPHAVQVPFDSPEVGTGLDFSINAPIQVDGRPGPGFTELLTARAWPDQLPLSAEETTYQLYLDGRLVPAEAAAADAKLDLRFSLAAPDATLPEQLQRHLQGLATTRLAALTTAAETLAALAELLTPGETSPTLPKVQAAADSLSLAQQGLDEATVALQRAAASIGQLEDAFAIALRKPISPPTDPESAALLQTAIDPAELLPIQPTIAEASNRLKTAPPLPAIPLTANQYQDFEQSGRQLAHDVNAMLVSSLSWLRECLHLGQVSRPAWYVHHRLEAAMRSLQTIDS